MLLVIVSVLLVVMAIFIATSNKGKDSIQHKKDLKTINQQKNEIQKYKELVKEYEDDAQRKNEMMDKQDQINQAYCTRNAELRHQLHEAQSTIHRLKSGKNNNK